MVVRNYCKIISAMLQYYDYGVLLCFEQVLIFQRCIQKYLQRRWYAASGERVVVVQTVKNPPATRETRVQSLGREDFVEQGMATHSSILAWRIPRTEEPDGLQFIGLQRVGHDWVTFTFTLSGSLKIPFNRCRCLEPYPESTKWIGRVNSRDWCAPHLKLLLSCKLWLML